jgi:hypothetical protein
MEDNGYITYFSVRYVSTLGNHVMDYTCQSFNFKGIQRTFCSAIMTECHLANNGTCRALATFHCTGTTVYVCSVVVM